jgi:NAD(P)-dependent dehydrogenase (short-subunit alcohol dehydrogenase family)
VNIGGLAIYRTGRPIATLRNVGVAAITKNMADELGPKGINVTAVHPGATRTGDNRRGIRGLGRSKDLAGPHCGSPRGCGRRGIPCIASECGDQWRCHFCRWREPGTIRY